jgi:sporulation protein YlmC with PRC-barrel domain
VNEILLTDLIGRRVLDADGRSIGRIEELGAEIELHAAGADYVVTEFRVGAYPVLDAIAGSHFGRHLLRVLPFAGPRRYRIPWRMIDISDPRRPRIRARASELTPAE